MGRFGRLSQLNFGLVPSLQDFLRFIAFFCIHSCASLPIVSSHLPPPNRKRNQLQISNNSRVSTFSIFIIPPRLNASIPPIPPSPPTLHPSPPTTPTQHAKQIP